VLYGPGIDNFGVVLFQFEDGPLSLLSLPVRVGLLIPPFLSAPSSTAAAPSLFKLVVDPYLAIGLALPGRLGKVLELPFL